MFFLFELYYSDFFYTFKEENPQTPLVPIYFKNII